MGSTQMVEYSKNGIAATSTNDESAYGSAIDGGA